MHIIAGLAIGIALLYFWLIGHWFARVLVFLMLGAIGFLLGLSVGTDQGGRVVCGIIGAVLAWPIAGLPVYFWRHQSRVLDRRVNHVLAVLGAGMPPRLPEGR